MGIPEASRGMYGKWQAEKATCKLCSVELRDAEVLQRHWRSNACPRLRQSINNKVVIFLRMGPDLT